MKSTSTAINHEWAGPYTAPYVGWGVDRESDVCTCDSPVSSDEDELDAWIKASNRWFKAWLTFYKIKRWLRL